MSRFLLPRLSWPAPPAPAVTYPLGQHTTITGRELLGGTLILGSETEAATYFAYLARPATSLITLSDKGSFLNTHIVTDHARERLTPPLDLAMTLERLCRWSAEHSPIYNPDAPPTLLLISLAEPDLHTLAHWQPTLQSHNFATVLRLTPEQALSALSRFRNLIVCSEAHAYVSHHLPLDLPEAPCLVRRSGAAMPLD